MGEGGGSLVGWISLAVSILTLVGGALFKATLDAREERLRREISQEITSARHSVMDRMSGQLGQAQQQLLEKVDKELYTAHHQEILRRLEELEKAIWIRGT